MCGGSARSAGVVFDPCAGLTDEGEAQNCFWAARSRPASVRSST